MLVHASERGPAQCGDGVAETANAPRRAHTSSGGATARHRQNKAVGAVPDPRLSTEDPDLARLRWLPPRRDRGVGRPAASGRTAALNARLARCAATVVRGTRSAAGAHSMTFTAQRGLPPTMSPETSRPPTTRASIGTRRLRPGPGWCPHRRAPPARRAGHRAGGGRSLRQGCRPQRRRGRRDHGGSSGVHAARHVHGLQRAGQLEICQHRPQPVAPVSGAAQRTSSA